MYQSLLQISMNLCLLFFWTEKFWIIYSDFNDIVWEMKNFKYRILTIIRRSWIEDAPKGLKNELHIRPYLL